MAPVRATRASSRNDPNFAHCSLTPEKRATKTKSKTVKRRKSFFNLTGQATQYLETHLVGVNKCKKTMDETQETFREYSYEMEREKGKLGFTDPNRKGIREFVEKIDVFMKEQLSGWFNKLITTALYPPDGSTPPTIPELESAWETLVPQSMAPVTTTVCF
eukprot:sb/3472812/